MSNKLKIIIVFSVLFVGALFVNANKAQAGYFQAAGYLDRGGCTDFAGWAWDQDLPNNVTAIHIYVDGAFYTGILANYYRSDLPGNGVHAFGFATPPEWKTGSNHTINLYVIDLTGEGNPNLIGSPYTLNCAPPPPSQPVITGVPACASGPYSVNVSWSGVQGSGFWVDFTFIYNFAPYANKYVGGATSTTIPSGFNLPWTLDPDTTYYVRVYNGTASATSSFSSPHCPTASIWADTTSPAYNTATVIRWNAGYVSSCSVSPPGWGGTSGAQWTPNLTSPATYTLSCSGAGGSASASVTIYPQGPPAPTASISADNTAPLYNNATIIRWNSSGYVDSCSVSPPGWGGTSGAQWTPNLTSPTTYTVTCSGPGGSGSASVTIYPGEPPPSCSSVTPTGDTVLIDSGTRRAYANGVVNATRVSFGFYGPNTTSWVWANNAGGGTWYYDLPVAIFTQGAVTVYSYMQNNSYGDTYCGAASFTIVTRPTAWISADTSSPAYNSATTIRWSSSNTSSCSVSPPGWGGTSGTQSTGAVTAQTTYTVSCSGPGGSVSASVTVTPVTAQAYGYVEAGNCNTFSGWGWDPDFPSTTTTIHVYVDGSFYTAVAANTYRADFPGNGYHGFGFTTPGDWKNGYTHTINLYVIDLNGNGNPNLNLSPVSLTCAPPPPSQPVITGVPACASGPYSVNVSWSGVQGTGFYVDFAYSSNFAPYNNKYVGGATSTTMPSGFSSAWNLDPDTTYYVRVYNGATSATSSFVSPHCPTASIWADTTSPAYNTATVIRWTSGYTSSCSVSPPGWTGTSSAQWTPNLTSPATYTLSCSGAGGSASASVTVSPQAPPLPTVSITVDNPSPTYNTATTIRWSSTGASSCSVTPPGWTGTSGAQGTGNLTTPVTYTASCSGPGGSASASVAVNTGPAPASQPVITGVPVCTPGGYNVSISWTGSQGSGFWVDISTASNFAPYYNKYVGGATSTTAPSGFSGSPNLDANTTYYVRVYNGLASTTASFSSPYCPANGAQYISTSVPTTMQAGSVYTASVTMKNIGSNTWTTAGAYWLGSQNEQYGSGWGVTRVALPSSIAYNQSTTFTFSVTAPSTGGGFFFQWRMVQDGVEWFGDYTPAILITVVKPSVTITSDLSLVQYNTATQIRWSSSGVTSCTVTPPGWTGTSGVQQTGNITTPTTYTATCSGSFGSTSTQVTVTPGSPPPSQPVITGVPACTPSSYTVNVSWTGSPGSGFWVDVSTDPTFWTFTNKSVGTATSTTLNIDTNSTYYVRVYNGLHSPSASFSSPYCPANGAQLISVSAPSSMNVNDTYAATVVMKNIGANVWTAANSYKLGSQNPGDNTTWGLARVVVPISVGYNQSVTFTVNMTAPAAPGTYNFQWRMVQEGVEWFGDSSTNQAIVVNAVQPTCTSAGPDDDWTVALSGVRRTYAYGVANATMVYFATFTNAQGGSNAIWYTGTNAGGGTWYADVDLANHPGIGSINVHVYLNNPGYGNSLCDSANFNRLGTGNVKVNSNIPTSWTLTTSLANPVFSLTQSSDITNKLYNLNPFTVYTVVPKAIDGYDVNVSPSASQTLQ